MNSPKQVSFEKVINATDSSTGESVVSFVCEPTSGNFLMKFEGRELTINNTFQISFYAYATEPISIGMCVMINGISDSKIQASKLNVLANGFTSDMMLGIATTSATTGSGFTIRMFGEVQNIRLFYPANTPLWADPLSPGLFTSTKPTGYPALLVGRVVKQSSSATHYNGILLTKPSFMSGLSDMFDTQITLPQAGDSLYFDGTKWINKRLSSVIVDTQEPEINVNNDLWFHV